MNTEAGEENSGASAQSMTMKRTCRHAVYIGSYSSRDGLARERRGMERGSRERKDGARAKHGRSFVGHFGVV